MLHVHMKRKGAYAYAPWYMRYVRVYMYTYAHVDPYMMSETVSRIMSYVTIFLFFFD